MQCPECLKTDLADGARRCQHCGSWLDPRKAVDEFETFRNATRAELSSDLDKHFKSIDSALKRMQWVAGFVLVAAGGLAIYFTGITQESIDETTMRIQEKAEASIDTSVKAIIVRLEGVIEKEVEARVRERMAATETAELIAAKIDSSLSASVNAAVESRFDPAKTQIDKLIGEAEASLELAAGTLDRVRSESETALREVADIRENFKVARELEIGGLSALVEFSSVSGEDKGGLFELPSMIENGVEVLRFSLGQSYYGPIAWKYLGGLRHSPSFQFVLLLDPSGKAVGIWDPAKLAAALNPPDQDALAARFGGDPEATPGEQEVPRWSEFADWLTSGATGQLAGLAGFVDKDNFVMTGWDNFHALDHLEQLGAERLPVLDDQGVMVGIVDRSRLTTRMLLEVVARRE